MGVRRKTVNLDPTKEVYRALRRTYENGSNIEYFIENLYVFNWESDILIKTKYGYWTEFEVKVSMSDFQVDKKKHKHQELISFDCLRPNYFAYAAPEDLAAKILNKIPYYAGLLSVSKGGFVTILKKPPLLHRNKYSDDELNLCCKFYFNFKNYKQKYEVESAKKIEELKSRIYLLEAEFEALNGFSIDECL